MRDETRDDDDAAEHYRSPEDRALHEGVDETGHPAGEGGVAGAAEGAEEPAPGATGDDAVLEAAAGTAMVSGTRLGRVDSRLSRFLVVAPRADGTVSPWVVAVRRFSEAGSYGVGWVIAFIVAGAATGGLVPALVAGACVIGTLVLNTAIKVVARRPRPVYRAIDHAPRTYSFPSAHTSMAMVGAVSMTVLLPGAVVLWWSIAGAIAVSRVVLGMHYVGDVVAGVVLGLALGLLVAGPLVAAAAG